MKSNRNIIWFYLILIVLVVFIATLFASNGSETPVTYSDVVGYFKAEKVKAFVVDQDNMLKMQLEGDKVVEYKLKYFEVFYDDLHELIEEQYANKIITRFDYEPATSLPWWVRFLPYLIVIVVLVVIWWMFITRAAGKSGGTSGTGGGLGGRMNSFTKARTKLGSDEKHKVLFSDVAGADEEKEELKEVVEFLKDPGHFSALGAKIPRGVLLVGAPGTGKTLLAKAVAGESGVPFYAISGSDFLEMYVGVGASRVRDLFETAKKTAPAIIFIDEIDAVGRHRGAGWGGGHDEREQTLNQLLVEMDGFGVNDGVIVIAATNRPDILDPALLRPGRFDRQVTINYPDIRGRVEILKVHSRNKPLAKNVDLETVARSTSGFTGADLANLLNEAALLAAREGKTEIDMEDIEKSEIKVIVGPQKKSLVITEEEKRNTAYHEAGHAVVGHFLSTQDTVHQVSIIPSGMAMGYTLSFPQEDKHNSYKSEMIDRISVLLGGRCAEKLVLHDISAGASNDIQRASELARKMVTQYGMSEKLGPIVFGTGHDEVFLGKDFTSTRNYSENIAAEIDQEVHSIIETAYGKAEAILKSNKDKLDFIAKYLVVNEVMDREQFLAVFEPDPTFEKLDAIKEAKRARYSAANADDNVDSKQGHEENESAE